MKPRSAQQSVSSILAEARKLRAEGKSAEAASLADTALPILSRSLARGVDPGSDLPRLYYVTELVKKFARIPNNFGSPVAKRRNMSQVLILDRARSRVLLQRRGPYKRQFAGCDSVTANAKYQDAGDLFSSAAKAVKDEVGFPVDLTRFELIGQPNQYETHFTHFYFFACSNAEAQRLRRVAETQWAGCVDPADVVVVYDAVQRSLNVFTLSEDAAQHRIASVVKQIEAFTRVPPIFAFSNTDDNTLLVYQLTEAEEHEVDAIMARQASARRLATVRMHRCAAEEVLEILDSDELHWVPWQTVRREALSEPLKFALPLTAHYFPHDVVWSAMQVSVPQLIPLTAPAAIEPSVSGGKGANLARLQQLSAALGCFRVPPAWILTPAVFEALVLGDPAIRADVGELDRLAAGDLTANAPALAACAARLRSRILALELPAALCEQVAFVFEQLGGDVAVRSSASVEDTREKSAAGQATTMLHELDVEAVVASILCVWASGFDDGFVDYRNQAGFTHLEFRMAVVLQSFVTPCAGGVVLSFDPRGEERPAYRISAQPGVCEGVVQAIGKCDSWLVGQLCEDTDILEREIPIKDKRVVAASSGGTRKEAVAIVAPSLTDAEVLAVARVSHQIHQHYRAHGLAEDIDIEYAVDTAGQLYLVQVRPKSSHKTLDAKGKPIVRVTTVDLTQLSPDAEWVQLSDMSIVAVAGAVTAILRLDRRPAESNCLAGCIAVADHTNNDYNLIFGSLAAVITADGDDTSHAAQHAYEKLLPAVVGASNAREALARWDGRVVTFDAGQRRVYLGRQPIITVERRLDTWLNDPAAIRKFSTEAHTHEHFRTWPESKAKRPEVFIEDFEGHSRMRSNLYRYFQLGVYHAAWDRATEVLTGMFADRTERVLKTQARLIKAIGDKHQLVHVVRDNDPESIYYYLMSVPDFGVADLEALFEARLEGFRRFSAFMSSLERIDGSNVERLVSEVIEVFVWMHMGYWLDLLVEEFAHRQLRYISNEGSFHNILRDAALLPGDLVSTCTVDPSSSHIPHGKVLNLSRERDKELGAVVEAIRADPRLREVFALENTSVICGHLREHFSALYARIEAWSMKYKLNREDLDVLSDTEAYIAELCMRLSKGCAMSTGLLSGIYRDYLKRSGAADSTLAALAVADPDLYGLCRAAARELAVQAGAARDAVSAAQIDALLPHVIAELEKMDQAERPLQAEAGRLLATYHDLQAILRVSRLQFPLREDGHHLIVPQQRKLARLMLAAAQPFVGTVFKQPADIFDISPDELVGLFHEPDPAFIALTLARWPLLLEAENRLKRCWSVTQEDFAALTPDVAGLWTELLRCDLINQYGALQDKCRTLRSSSELDLAPAFEPIKQQVFAALMRPMADLSVGLQAFERSVAEAVALLEQQVQAATLPALRASYRAEQARLQERVQRLKARAASEGWL